MVFQNFYFRASRTPPWAQQGAIIPLCLPKFRPIFLTTTTTLRILLAHILECLSILPSEMLMARLMLVGYFLSCSLCYFVVLGAQDLYNGLSPWSDPKKVGDQKQSKSRFPILFTC
jgi:hypothetical protein